VNLVTPNLPIPYVDRFIFFSRFRRPGSNSTCQVYSVVGLTSKGISKPDPTSQIIRVCHVDANIG
jgi:hypothetical protein